MSPIWVAEVYATIADGAEGAAGGSTKAILTVSEYAEVSMAFVALNLSLYILPFSMPSAAVKVCSRAFEA